MHAVDAVKKHLKAGNLAELVAKHEQQIMASSKYFVLG